MKNKRWILVAILAVTLIASLVLTACQHQHEFDELWSRDSEYHWLECECGERSEQAEHSFGSWAIDVRPTETTEGSRHRNCSVCGYKQTGTIDPLGGDHTHTFDALRANDSEKHYAYCSVCGEPDVTTLEYHTWQWIIDSPATVTADGSKHQQCVQCEYKLPAIVIPRLESATRTVNFYAINDFHGEWARMSQIAGFLTERKANGNTLLVNSGDMFQGSMESNSNFGKLLSECMDDTGFDSFTFGNHEFDWGLDNLRELASNSNVPFLGANIYNWNRATGWGGFASDLAQEYVVKTLDNGLTVGIIGVIGKDQITSISSQLVQSIGFKDPKEVVPELSQKLRNELGCDVVVVSAHTGQETFLNDRSWDITQYADAVFCAHTHSAEQDMKNGVPFIQGGSYGRYVANVTLEVDENGNVSCAESRNIGFDNSWPNKISVSNRIDNSNEKIKDEAQQVLAKLTDGYLNSSTAVPRLVSHAIANYAAKMGYEIDLAMVNNARNSLEQGNVTYTELYEAIPFDNVVYIAKVQGKDILNEARYDSNSIWRVSGVAIENNKYYTIAVIDYLLFHQNSNRNYNYFPSAFTSGFAPVPLTKEGVDVYNYRLITKDFLLEQGSVSAMLYVSSNNDRTNKDLLQSEVTFTDGYSALSDYSMPLAIILSQCILPETKYEFMV